MMDSLPTPTDVIVKSGEPLWKNIFKKFKIFLTVWRYNLTKLNVDEIDRADYYMEGTKGRIFKVHPGSIKEQFTVVKDPSEILYLIQRNKKRFIQSRSESFCYTVID